MSTSPGTDSSSPYQTPTRHSGTNYIRLIKLLPGSPESPIACTLHELELEKPGEFTALSYTWGKPDPTFEITLNGRQIQVRENLCSFLKQARELGRSELLWIDVISINQDNIEERNHQVALMGQVYRRAAKVVVW
ncbi:HET-domain-containing protein, partial [Paraphaeosphaeria sporulosa]